MSYLDDQSIDLVLCDLPYGTTSCAWDSTIALDELWIQYKRIVKSYHPIVLTGSQPFTTTLIHSNLEWFKYEWIWIKNRATNFVHAKNKPMKKHENVLVFSEGTTVHASQSNMRMPYFPQGLKETGDDKLYKKLDTQKTDVFFADRPGHRKFTRDKTGYPNSVIYYDTDQLGLHPTAKPEALMEYMIRTYSEPGDVVLDNTMGSGTTGVACLNSGRFFIGIEKDPEYFTIADNRIRDKWSEMA